MSKNELNLAEQKILNRIHIVRGEKVMLDRDLAELYGMETRALKQAVKRNMERFPQDFMFEMTPEEFATWRENTELSKEARQGLRHPPFCFTEQGVTMLSCVLSSSIAVEVNIRIVRVFVKIREYALTHTDILLQLARLEKEVKGNSVDIENIFTVLRELLEKNRKPTTRRTIGFKIAG